VEVSHVRRRVQGAIVSARQQAQLRRQATAEAERGYALLLEQVATPLAHQIAAVLKAEGLTFTVFTPGDGLRLAADRGRDDFIELSLDTDAATPQVIGQISYTRGSRTITEERPIKPGTSPAALTEEDVLEFFVSALEPWLASR
jgi:hypothetical protein